MSIPGMEEEKWIWVPILFLSGACRLAIATCEGDTNQAYDDCLNGCNTSACLDCCYDKVESDLVNCYASCGANGPDGDYGNCHSLYNKDKVVSTK